MCPTERKKTWSGKPYYEGWFILRKYGEVLSGFCNCFGGADGACRHLSASLFDLERTLTKQNDLSCTSKCCTWIQKKRDLNPTPAFKLNLQKKGDNSLPAQLESHHKFDPRPRSVIASAEKRQKLLLDAIHDIHPEAVCLDILPELTPETISLHRDFPVEHDINVTREEEAIIKPHAPCMPDIIREFKMGTTSKKLTTVEYFELAKDYVLNYKVSKNQRDEISLITMGQSKNLNWFMHRIGRITGSVAHRVHTRREGTDPTSLVNVIMGKTSLDDEKLPPQMKYGQIHEDDAIQHYVSMERLNSPKFSVRKTGLVLLNDCSFLGASPDGITSDGRVVEAKCSWKYREKTPKEAAISSGHVLEVEGQMKLKTSSPWYTQMQFEMAACELEEGVLLIYTDKGICIVFVPFDKEFWLRLQEKMKAFFLEFVLPVLFD